MKKIVLPACCTLMCLASFFIPVHSASATVQTRTEIRSEEDPIAGIERFSELVSLEYAAFRYAEEDRNPDTHNWFADRQTRYNPAGTLCVGVYDDNSQALCRRWLVIYNCKTEKPIYWEAIP